MDDKEGYEYAMKATRLVLRFLGAWPNHHKRTENWLSRSHFIVPAFLIVYFINIPQTMKIIKVWGNLNAVLDILVTANIANFVALIKLLCVRYNKKVIGPLILSMKDDWKSLKTCTESRIMWKNAKLSRLMTLVIYTLTWGTLIFYIIMAVYMRATESKQEFDLTLNKTTKLRPLYVKSHFFYDVQKTPLYDIVWMLQLMAMTSGVLSFMAVDSLFTVLILHLCGQLVRLQERLKNVTKNLTRKRCLSYRLSTIVLRHEHLNRFAEAVENAFNAMFLVQILLSGMVLCLQGYQLVTILTSPGTVIVTELLFMAFFTLCFVFSLFVYCYVAEKLRTESTEIGNAAYQCNWYDLPAFETRLFILIISRSKTPLEITAGKFAAFSLELYCSILKSSGGYLSMLLAVKDRLAA